jgi:ABC-2 type transport system ATP-binding protein
MPTGNEIDQLQKVLQDQVRLEIDHLKIEPGTVVGVVGPAGSGKELLFELFLGRDIPSKGTVLLNGKNPAVDRSELSTQVGYLFADDSVYPRMTVIQNLTFLTKLRGLPAAHATKLLGEVGLSDRAKDPIGKLPESLSRRLAFGCAILHDPKILILYEPFERCDRATIDMLGQLIRRRAADGGAIVILAGETSNLVGVCDTIYHLDQGQIVDTMHPADDQPENLPFKIPVKLEGSVALLNPSDILFAEADENRAFLNTIAGDRLASQFTLSELETRLSRSGFFRAHRGYLVNLQHVTEVIPFTRNSFSLRLNDEEGTLIPLSKTAAAELRQILDY